MCRAVAPLHLRAAGEPGGEGAFREEEFLLPFLERGIKTLSACLAATTHTSRTHTSLPAFLLRSSCPRALALDTSPAVGGSRDHTDESQSKLILNKNLIIFSAVTSINRN